jgi:hypothetical protein
VEALKRALYKPAKDKKTDKERIRLSAHFFNPLFEHPGPRPDLDSWLTKDCVANNAARMGSQLYTENFQSADWSDFSVHRNFCRLLFAYGLWNALFVSLENTFEFSAILSMISVSKQLNRRRRERRDYNKQEAS